MCDLAETCSGSGADCPTDGLASTAVVCRGSAGLCDLPEHCTGTGTSCPGDGFVAGGTPCRASTGVCDISEVCTGSNADCPGDGFAGTGTVCRNSTGICDVPENCTGSAGNCPPDLSQPDDTPCDDGAFCTIGDVCTSGECGGTIRGCSDGIACTVDGCDEAADSCTHDGDNSQCDDDEPCTVDVCEDNFGCVYTWSCNAGICRTAGYWSTHAGYERRNDNYNVTQAVLDAVGGIDLCGLHVTETSNLNRPYVQGLGLSSALEGLCISIRGDQELQLYRQLTAAALNCAISGGDCDETLVGLIDVAFSACSDLCETGIEEVDGPSVNECIEKLDCYNNGWLWVDGTCAAGYCELAPELSCGGFTGACPEGDCVPFEGSCHSQPLCNKALGVCPKRASASSSRACREALGNDCTLLDCP